MSGKYALIIANTEYTDSGLAQLTAPGKDAKDFARVLQEKDLCGFDHVSVLLNQTSATVNEAIDDFFYQKKPDDLLLLYFSGHGVRDELGKLYLAVKNTNRHRLRVTAIKSDFIKESMDQSRSRRQVLILDCCNSGAFAQGAKSAIGTSIGTATAFEGGYGRIVLTASDATQIAWEGDKIIGETQNSLFTHYLVKGLLGEADRDGNGQITVDELYDYAYEQVKLATPNQTPSKFSSKQQGEIILRKNMRIEDISPLPLPDQLLQTLENPFSDVRLGAVRQLSKLADGKNLGMARSAMDALERVAKEDDSRTVSRAAFEAVEVLRRSNAGNAHTEINPVTTDQNVSEIAGTYSMPTTKKLNVNFVEQFRKAVDFIKKKRHTALTILYVAATITFLFLLALATKVMVFDPANPSTTLRIENILTSNSLEKRIAAKNFNNGEDIYTHLSLNYIPPGTEFKAKWYYRFTTLGNNGYILLTTNKYSLKQGENNIYFYLNDLLLKGSYRVDIYLDGELVGARYFSVR